MSVSDWSSTADENTAINGIDISEHCPAKNMNNALRAVMAAVKAKCDALDATDNSLRRVPEISTVTLSDALTAGTLIEVPEHTVGDAGMAVYLCGIRCARGAGAQYLDVDSTHISFNDDIEAGMDIAVVVIF